MVSREGRREEVEVKQCLRSESCLLGVFHLVTSILHCWQLCAALSNTQETCSRD